MNICVEIICKRVVRKKGNKDSYNAIVIQNLKLTQFLV